jgi:hypothetical protein
MSPHATRYSWLTFRLRTVFLFMTVSALILGVSVQGRFGGIRVVGLTAVGLAFE